MKLVDPVDPALSFAVTTTLNVPLTVGVPETDPVVLEILRPVGRPVAVQRVMWANADESVAERFTSVRVPTGSDCGPGFVTVTVFTTFQ